MKSVKIPSKRQRQYLPSSFSFNSWAEMELYAKDLEERDIQSVGDLQKWMNDTNELQMVIGEGIRWLMVKSTCDTTDENIKNEYANFVANIQPHLTQLAHNLDLKFLETPYLEDLDKEKYFIHIRNTKNSIALFCEENIPLYTQLRLKEKEYSQITGKATVTIDGEELTLQQASKKLAKRDRNLRERVYTALIDRKLQNKQELNDLFDELVEMRHQMALNAKYENFRDFKFASLGRFDYTIEDCFQFHDSIAKVMVPLSDEIDKRRKIAMGVADLRPWDMSADPLGKPALRPFDKTPELVEKTANCLDQVKPKFGDYLRIMDQMGHLDLDSRKGKAPGGYNCGMPESGVPFIFMNAVGSMRDVTTMVHEGGHAIHSFLTKDLELLSFQNVPSEVAELASMSMELISMEHWGVSFFSGKEELVRAKIQQLEKVISGLPWIALVDKFQHWIYMNPTHTAVEREEAWRDFQSEFESNVVNYDGMDEYRASSWLQQLHIFEVPFYYIEYGMAQLGAIAVWRNYKQNPQKALEKYEAALSLGYTKTIPEIYKAAGIQFNFSLDYVEELGAFVNYELHRLYDQLDSLSNVEAIKAII